MSPALNRPVSHGMPRSRHAVASFVRSELGSRSSMRISGRSYRSNLLVDVTEEVERVGGEAAQQREVSFVVVQGEDVARPGADPELPH